MRIGTKPSFTTSRVHISNNLSQMDNPEQIMQDVIDEAEQVAARRGKHQYDKQRKNKLCKMKSNSESGDSNSETSDSNSESIVMILFQ